MAKAKKKEGPKVEVKVQELPGVCAWCRGELEAGQEVKRVRVTIVRGQQKEVLFHLRYPEEVSCYEAWENRLNNKRHQEGTKENPRKETDQ